MHALLQALHARLQLGLRPAVAGLARPLDVQHRAAHVVVADLQGARALVGHVTVGTCDSRPGVHALVPQLELGVLRLEDGRACLGVGPVLVAHFVVVGQDVLDLQALRPGIDDPLLRPLEVVLDVALPAHIGPHLLAGGVAVHVVGGHSLRGLERRHAFHEPGTRDPQLHRLRVVAVDAGHGVLDQLPRLGVRHLVHGLEALDQVSAPELPVGHIDGAVALHAGARLLRDLLALREGLVIQHEGMPPLLAEVPGEGIARPHRDQPRVFLEA